MSTVVIDCVRGLPDGTGFVPYRITVDTATRTPLNHEGLIGDTWLPWQVIVDSTFPPCACGGTGYQGPGWDPSPDANPQKGSMLPCRYCANGEHRRTRLNSRGR